RFHQSAVEQNRRVGPGWEPVKAPLEELLKQVRRERLKIFVGRGQWAQAGRIAMRLGVDYPNDRGVLRDIYHLQLAEAAATLRPDAADSFEDFRRLRDALDQYVERVAEEGKGDELVGAARRRLREEAERYAAEARKLAAAGDAAAAREQLLRAQRLDPALEGVSELRSALDAKYPILYVGMRGLPERVSPPLARTDADRRAVELVFEGLVEAVPDRTLGRRYRPVLAEAAPGLVPLGRSFRLRPGVKWAPPGGSPGEPPRPFDANDVRGTLEMLRAKPDTWAARDAVLLEEVRGIANPLRLDLILRRGYLDPLAPMTFKVLPARRLRQSQSGAFDTGFARQPVGTGPYRFDGVEREQSGRLCAVFRANPYYGQRPGQLGRPFIREIRLFDVTGSSDPVADLARGNMHIWLDLTSADLARLRADAAAAAQARIYTNRSHRRVHFLAVNHRMPALQSPELRRGLAAAIDREKILDEVFRAGEAGAHRALAGPFPPGSWPAPEKAQPLHNAVLAGSLLGEKAPKELRLAYPADDPAAQEACQRIKEQIEQAAGGKTEVILEKFPPEELYRKVELEHVFDLAYYHFDYADDLFWLGGLFDRGATGTGGRNYMGYLGQGAGAEDLRLEQLVNAPHEHRDFALLRRQAAALHAQFVTQMPFIPLWHLDRHAAVRRDVEIVIEGADADPSLLDPATFFTGVEAWKLR
ncbi:MAG TPA: ABC transporter substrate-binding protein, partial [Gemmataceae bacterium]